MPAEQPLQHRPGWSGWAGRALRACVASPALALIAVVRGYRLLLKPWLGNACRFEPSCSAYTLQALKQHGASGGVLLGGWRLLRCQPWCVGGCDPVPDDHPLRRLGLFTRFTANPQPTGVNDSVGSAAAEPKPAPVHVPALASAPALTRAPAPNTGGRWRAAARLRSDSVPPSTSSRTSSP